MPETIDSPGSPEFSELPALHTPTPGGNKPKTPTDPGALTGPTPVGMGKAPSPMGMPGAPPAGGKPPMQPTPEAPMEALNNRSIESLGQDIRQLVNKYDIKSKEELKDRILEEEDWKVDRINELIDYTDSLSSEELFEKAVDREYEPGVENTGIPDLQSPPVDEKTGPPTLTKPDNDQTGLNPTQTTAILKTRGVLMKQAILKDGTLVVKEASTTDVSEVITGITNARRNVEATLKDYINAKLIKAGMDSLGMDAPMKEDIGSILGGPPIGEEDGLSAVIKKLKEVVEELIVALEEGDAVKSDSAISISPDDEDKLDGAMDKGKDVIKDVKDKGPLSDMKKDEKEEDDDEKESSEEDGTMKEAGKDSQKAMDVAMGKVGPEKKKEKKEKKDKKAEEVETPEATTEATVEATEETPTETEVTAETEEGKEVTAEEGQPEATEEPAEGEVTATEEGEGETTATASESIVNKIMTRVTEMKKANLYPFKDLNKQQVDNTNATTAKDQIKTIDKEIKGGKQPSSADSSKAPSISPTDIKTDLKAQKGKVSVEAAERIKQHSVDNAISKARLSVELAARQQLKGLLENPLKQACVKNMVEAGIPEETADAITHNAFIDGYEDMQKYIIKEAFDTFMNEDIKDFIKVAEFTDSYKVKESSEAPVEGDGTQVKTASAAAPLRGTQVKNDRKAEFKKFWETVSYQRKGGEI